MHTHPSRSEGRQCRSSLRDEEVEPTTTFPFLNITNDRKSAVLHACVDGATGNFLSSNNSIQQLDGL